MSKQPPAPPKLNLGKIPNSECSTDLDQLDLEIVRTVRGRPEDVGTPRGGVSNPAAAKKASHIDPTRSLPS